jgi:tRNA threonylcarbamoyladenosine biosynthesis protein TsaE
MFTITSTSPEATRDLGRRLAAALRAGDVVALQGDLGAGKTVFAQGLAAGMQVAGRVTSPTFIIMRCHAGVAGRLFHVDAYRLTSGLELVDMGLDDWLAEGVVAVEWAEKVADVLPADHLEIRFEHVGEQRRLTLTAHGPRARELLEHLQRC